MPVPDPHPSTHARYRHLPLKPDPASAGSLSRLAPACATHIHPAQIELDAHPLSAAYLRLSPFNTPSLTTSPSSAASSPALYPDRDPFIPSRRPSIDWSAAATTTPPLPRAPEPRPKKRPRPSPPRSPAPATIVSIPPARAADLPFDPAHPATAPHHARPRPRPPKPPRRRSPSPSPPVKFRFVAVHHAHADADTAAAFEEHMDDEPEDDGPFEHGPTELPPRPYPGGEYATSPLRPRARPGKIPASTLDFLPVLEARFARLETAIERYVEFRAQQALRNSLLPAPAAGGAGQ